MEITIVLGWWIIPLVLSVVPLWFLLKPQQRSGDYDFSGPFVLLWLIPLLVIWLVYLAIALFTGIR